MQNAFHTFVISINNKNFEMKNVFPTAELNGVLVANHSSEHTFSFDNGVKLGGVSKEQCTRLCATQSESIVQDCGGYKIVATTFKLSDEVVASFYEAIELVGKNGLVLVSRVHRNAINENLGIDALPQVVCGITIDRVTKIVSSTKFSH